MTTRTRRQRPSWQSAIAVIAAVILLLLFVYHLVGTLALFIVAALFAIYLSAVTDFLEQKLHLERIFGLPLALGITGLGITAIGWLIVPPVAQQVRELLGMVPDTVVGWTSFLLDLGERYPVVRGVLPDAAAIERQIATVQTNLTGYFGQLIPYLFSGVGLAIHLVSVIVMAIYLTLNPSVYVNGFVRMVPVKRRRLARSILTELGTTLRAWIGAQMAAMVILGVLTWIGLLFLQVPFALAFSVFTGVAVIVPFFGSLSSTVLPAMFVLGQGDPLRALLVLLLGIVVHLIEANLVHPLIMERQINLPPVLSILSVLIMADLFGPFGLLLAVPVLAVLMVLVRRVYVEEILERKKRKMAEPLIVPSPDVQELKVIGHQAPAVRPGAG
jgi:predicted PurR-regulated permease PerM